MRLVLLAILPLALGCTPTATTTTVGVGTGEITIAGASFAGGVTCGNRPGTFRSYVATVTDETNASRSFVLPSAGPIGCRNDVSFTYIAAGRSYTAEIDGYDLDPRELTPLGGAGSGSRRMVIKSSATGEIASPRWSSSCPTLVAVNLQNVTFDCDPLVDHGTVGPSSVSLDPKLAFATPCATDPTLSFVVTSPALPAPQTVACDAAPIVLDMNVLPGDEIVLDVAAKDASGSEVAAAQCVAVAIAGTSVSAACSPFTTVGGLRIDASSLPGTADFSCFADVDQTISGEPSASIFPCSSGAVIMPLAVGTHQVGVTAKSADGTKSLSFSCTGDVARATVSSASCK